MENEKIGWELEQELREVRTRKKSLEILQEVQSGKKTSREVFDGDGKDIEGQRARCPGCESFTFGFNKDRNAYTCCHKFCIYHDDKSKTPTELKRLAKFAEDYETVTGDKISREGLIKLDTYNLLGLRE